MLRISWTEKKSNLELKYWERQMYSARCWIQSVNGNLVSEKVKSSQVAFNKNKWQSHKYYMQIAKTSNIKFKNHNVSTKRQLDEHSLEQLVVTGHSGGEESKRASKTEVSRQIVYMLGRQSEPDTDHQGCTVHRTDCSGTKWSPTSCTMTRMHGTMFIYLVIYLVRPYQEETPDPA